MTEKRAMADENKTKAPPPPAKKAGPPAPPPPKNPGFVTATIDGREVVVKPGTTVIEGAKKVGVEIPYYCYHKRLSVAANCRMCLVEMSNAPMGKLMPACQMTLAEGVTVRTDTPRVKDQQRATLEFLLLNHPVDCAICDQSGECKLQDYYMAYDRQPSRLDVPKVMKRKRVFLGPLVTLDQERCILCTRCVRFMREVAKDPQLGVAERGNRSFIETAPGQPLDNKYSGNVVDICPVGALTSTDFRFRGRVWFMSAARSLCTGCARGCNTFLDYLNDTTYRYRPRENDAVNQEWMCDDGRLSYKPLNRKRVLGARAGRGEGARALSREEAVAKAAAILEEGAEKGELALLLSPTASLEDALVTLAVAKDAFTLSEVFLGGRPDGWQDDFLKRADENPNRRGVELAARGFGMAVRPFEELLRSASAGAVKVLWAVGTELPAEEGAAKLSGLRVVAQATSLDALSEGAEVLLPASTHAESDGTFVNFEGRAQRFEMAYFPRGSSRPHFGLSGEIGRALGAPHLYGSAREAFRALSPRLGDALGDYHWDSLPSIGRRPGLIPLAAGTVDGRLPGYRERVPPEASGEMARGEAAFPEGGQT